MTAKELMEILGKANPDALVMVEITNNDGCDSCGWGASSDEHDVLNVIDNEARVVIIPDDHCC